MSALVCLFLYSSAQRRISDERGQEQAEQARGTNRLAREEREVSSFCLGLCLTSGNEKREGCTGEGLRRHLRARETRPDAHAVLGILVVITARLARARRCGTPWLSSSIRAFPPLALRPKRKFEVYLSFPRLRVGSSLGNQIKPVPRQPRHLAAPLALHIVSSWNIFLLFLVPFRRNIKSRHIGRGQRTISDRGTMSGKLIERHY